MRLYELLVAHMNGNRGVVDMMTNISLMTIRTCTPRTSRRSVRWTTTGLGKRPHDLRHTAASLWMAAGVDIQDGVGVNPQWQWTGAAGWTRPAPRSSRRSDKRSPVLEDVRCRGGRQVGRARGSST